MKQITLLIFLGLNLALHAQHTFSIVAVDPETGEIGSAGATCLAAEDGAQDISDIVLGVGAIHTQSFYLEANKNNARTRMEAGDSPQEIMDWLVANDVQNDPSERQYLAVDLDGSTPRSAAYTGPDCFEEFIQVTGSNYAIAGNILVSEDVVLDMETAFVETDGTLAEKLMAALQGAKRPGADVRCLNDGVSSASAFIRVADPSDTDASYGNLSLDLNVWITDEIFEPIDELQVLFDASLSANRFTIPEYIEVFPNPTSGIIQVKSVLAGASHLEVVSITGQQVFKTAIQSNTNQLDLGNLPNGIYFVALKNDNTVIATKKIVLHK